MKRNDWLARMGLQLPPQAQIRVVVCSDVSNEADDPFAVLHHLLTPSFDVRGIVAAHFESKAPGSRATMEQSYQGLLTLLVETGMEDVPALRGCTAPLADENDAPDSEGVEFLIREALRDDPRPLYVTVLGALTDVAAALNRCPAIADRLTVVWIGGGPYPQGMREFNLTQDLAATRVVFASPAACGKSPWMSTPPWRSRWPSWPGGCGPAAGLEPTSTGSWRTTTGTFLCRATGCTAAKTGRWATSPPWGCCCSVPCGATGTPAPRPGCGMI